MGGREEEKEEEEEEALQTGKYVYCYGWTLYFRDIFFSPRGERFFALLLLFFLLQAVKCKDMRFCFA